MVSWLLKKRKGTDVNAICFSNCYGRRRVGSVLFTLMLITHLNLTSVEYTMFSYTYFSFAVPPWWWVYYRFPFVKCEKLKLMLVFFSFQERQDGYCLGCFCIIITSFVLRKLCRELIYLLYGEEFRKI